MAAIFTHCTTCGCALPSASQLTVCMPCAFASASAPAAELPEIEGIEILSLAGEGGMGRVYRGRQTAAGGRIVAVKVLPPGVLSPGADERFAREAELLARLSHPGVAAVYGAGLTECGERYLMMEWVEGRPLPEAVRASRLDPAKIAALMAKACEAVQAAHAINIVHRDLKPANLLADAESGNVKVLDFGLARDLEELRGLSLSGAVLGTPDFMAPEQIRGEPCGPAADVFALGIILYLCLTGNHPFPATTLSQRLAVSTAARPPELKDSIPQDLKAILCRSLEASPSVRYRTAGEMAEDLRRWLEGRPVLARTPGGFYYLRKFVARHRAASAVAGLILMGTAGAGIWHWHTREEAARELQAQYADTLLVSAELHGQRGLWAPALSEIAKAEQAGARDPARVAQARIEALVAAGRRAEARQVMETTAAGTLAPAIRAYWQAHLLDSYAQIPRAEALLREAHQAGLPPALAAITQALLSDDELETEEHLARAVKLEPWNHQALLLHSLALAFTGQTEQARLEAAASARLFPESPDLKFGAGLIAALTTVDEAGAGNGEASLLADMRFLMVQRSNIYRLAWQMDGSPITRVLKAKTILARVNSSQLMGNHDAAGADDSLPSLVLRFLTRLQQRELESVKLLHGGPDQRKALEAMLESEMKRRRPSPVVVCNCASQLLQPALKDDALAAKVESACAAAAAQPGVLDGERALLLEMCATQTLFRVKDNPDPEPKRRSVDYAKRRLAIQSVPFAPLPARVIAEGMAVCGEFEIARTFASASSAAAKGDANAILTQMWVESKAGEWQRCLAFAESLPPSTPATIRSQAEDMKKEAVEKLKETLQRLTAPP